MKVFVTGASGLIGGWLCAHLADAGHDVIAFARSIESAVRIPTQTGILTRVGTLPTDLTDVDAVVHLAAPNAAACAENSDQAVRDTVEPTRALVAKAIAAKCERFVYVSTAKVYGAALGKISEATQPQPQDTYAAAHLSAEAEVLGRSLDAVVLRLANGFGAPVHPDVNCWTTIVNGFARAAVAEGRIVLQSPGLAWRSFVPMTDVCAAISHALTLRDDQIGDGVFNLGVGCDETIRAMAERVARRASAILGRVVDVDAPSGAHTDTSGSASIYDGGKLAATGFVPEKNIDSEIDALLIACRNWFGAGHV